MSNFCTQKFAVSKGSSFGRVWDSVSISFLQGSPCGPLFAKVRRMKLVSFSCPHHLKLDFAESPSAGLRSPHCDYFPFTRKDRTSAFCVVLLFLQESSCKLPCRLTQPALRLLSFHEESNQRRAKEEVSSLDSPPEGHIPSGTSPCEVLSPCLLHQRENVGFCSCHFGQQSAFVECTDCRYTGVQRGSYLTPFAGGQGTRWFLVCSL